MDQTERNIAAAAARAEAQTDELRHDLDAWIEKRSPPAPAGTVAGSKFPGPYAAINAALLDTALDRMLALHGGPDTRAMILAAYDRRLAVHKRSLQ